MRTATGFACTIEEIDAGRPEPPWAAEARCLACPWAMGFDAGDDEAVIGYRIGVHREQTGHPVGLWDRSQEWNDEPWRAFAD